MEPTMLDQPGMLLVGFSFFGDPFRLSGGWTEENEIGRLWTRFMAYLGAHHARIKHVATNAVMYEVHVEHQETATTGQHEVFVGLEVDRLEDVPVELSVKVFPPATYAIFTLHGDEITSDWTRTILEWMTASGVQPAHPYSVQRYDERFKGVDHIDESVLEVHVPITQAREP
ncbi:MAG: GyrI-like domain-containing protein [Chloroflexi bacterium]|nr:GyrI-like domain-containing protein [Chloroflexota bacterium]MBU1751490.1 GyrI-like domain-containing protein [Chloroflexota bacterium]MBU1879226.1 GyrI-like domain-containing protein [Chloroflexota bacterium]